MSDVWRVKNVRVLNRFHIEEVHEIENFMGG